MAQACSTLLQSMDCSLPVSFVHGISQARTVEWVSAPDIAGGEPGWSQWTSGQTVAPFLLLGQEQDICPPLSTSLAEKRGWDRSIQEHCNRYQLWSQLRCGVCFMVSRGRYGIKPWARSWAGPESWNTFTLWVALAPLEEALPEIRGDSLFCIRSSSWFFL